MSLILTKRQINQRLDTLLPTLKKGQLAVIETACNRSGARPQGGYLSCEQVSLALWFRTGVLLTPNAVRMVEQRAFEKIRRVMEPMV